MISSLQVAMQGWLRILRFKKNKPSESLTENELLEKLRGGCDNPINTMWDLATLYAKTSQPTKAFSYLERLISNIGDKDEKTFWYMKMGITMEEVEDYESAILCYSRVFSFKPSRDMDCYFMNNNMGYCLSQLGRYRESEPYCRVAIEIDPTRHNAYKNLGVSLDGQGQYQEAADCYVKAATICPDDPRASRHFESLWLKMRKLD